MSNESTLREQSVLFPLIQYVLRRLKDNSAQAAASVDCKTIFPLVDPSNLPFTCNFAVVVLFTILKSPRNCNEEGCKLLLEAMARFEPFTVQHNNLLHMVFSFLEVVSDSVLSVASLETRTALVDWFLDVALVQQEISKDGIGSILAGLSKARVDRLLMRADKLTLMDVKTWKLGV
jgi:hypothetical protein